MSNPTEHIQRESGYRRERVGAYVVERKIIRNNVSVDQEVGGVLQKGDMALEERYKIRSGYNQE